MFGQACRDVSCWLKFGIVLLTEILNCEPCACVRGPMSEETITYIEAVVQWHPILENHYVAFCMDGLKLHIQNPPKKCVQNRYYNGWMHGTYVGPVVVFALNVTIVACGVNYPRSFHDSKIADLSDI